MVYGRPARVKAWTIMFSSCFVCNKLKKNTGMLVEEKGLCNKIKTLNEFRYLCRIMSMLVEDES